MPFWLIDQVLASKKVKLKPPADEQPDLNMTPALSANASRRRVLSTTVPGSTKFA
jgi:hypothetical protein